MIERIWLMSAYATVLIAIVLGIRCLLKQYSKVYCYSLWVLVIIRLVCPVFLTSNLSVQKYVPNTVKSSEVTGQIIRTYDVKDSIASPVQTIDSMETSEISSTHVIEGIKAVWLLGVVLVGGAYFAQYMRIKKRLQTAIKEQDNIWLSDQIESPFVFGLCRPRIYLPYGLQGKERDYIIQHESTHIRHKDAWIRVVGVVAVCLHWWNPMVWYCIHKVNQDMEMFCDETVLQSATNGERKEYAIILLRHSIKKSGMTLALAFGETNTEKRIRHISRGKKKRETITIIMGMMIAVLSVCFGTMPKEKVEGSSATIQAVEKTIKFAGGDEAFLEKVASSPEEAKAFVNEFFMAVSKNEKEKVASMMVYPRELKIGNEIVTMNKKEDLIKHYDLIFTGKFKEELAGWLDREIDYNYLGMFLNDGNVWMLLGENGWFIDSIDNEEGITICFQFPRT